MSSTSKEATLDDSLVVHPATQAVAQDSNDSASIREASDPSSSPAGEDSQGFWEAKEILDEAGSKYLISWKGTDENGKPWEPTWEPKANANSLLIESWRNGGRARKKKADKQRRHEEKNRGKAAKKAGKERKHVSRICYTPPVASERSSRDDSAEVQEPPRKVVKRKMVLSDSEASSQPHQLVEEHNPVEVAPLKRVKFDVIVIEDDNQNETASPPQQVCQDKAEAVAAASSEETSGSLVPDSQCLPILLLDRREAVEDSLRGSQGHASGSTSSASSRARQIAQLNSPATSHSDLDGHSCEGDEYDELSMFDPIFPDRRSSPEAEAVQSFRHLRRVPVPRAAAFGLHHLASSQLDPIENPDSSPRRSRSPFDLHYHQRSASSQLRPSRSAKKALELVTVEDESPASSFEAEVQSSTAASYVSLPIPAISSITHMVGGSPLRPASTRTAVSSSIIAKPQPFRPPTPPAEAGISVGRAAVASVPRPPAALRAASLEVVEESQVEAEQAEEFVQEFLDNFLDFVGGASQDMSGKVGGEAQDAGEGGYPSGGYNPYGAGAPPSGAGNGGPPPGPSHIPGYIPAPQPGAMPLGYGYAAPGYPGGGGFPPMHLPPTHAYTASPYPQPVKRERDYEDGGDSKKPRTDQYGRPLPQAESPVPAAQPPHHAIPSPYPSAYYPPQTHVAQPPPSPFQTHSHSPQPFPPSASSPYTAPLATRPPALNVISPSPVTTGTAASPSLARVQNTGPVSSAPASNGHTAPSSPAQTTSLPTRPPSPHAASIAPSAPVNPSSSAVIAFAPSTTVSRNGSPAPTAAKVDELIALVRASPYILETDGTKVEIEKFLRDPLGYKASADAPLMGSEFWAFELRRQNQQGAEKADFVVLRSKEGNYQLKRAARDKVEFATSLSHTASRMRGLTPAVETAGISNPAPPPPLQPSQMTRDQLEQEVERLRQANQAAETELAALRPAAAEAAKLAVDVQTLQKTNKSLQNSRDSAQSDLVYVQAQYQAASGAAVERANEARLAEEETARLRTLLDTGLQQKQQLHAAKEKQLKSEVAKLRKEMGFYKEQSRRTNEFAVREAAAKWAEHVAAMKIRTEEEARRARGEIVEEDVDTSDDEVDATVTTAASVGEVAAATAAAASSSQDFHTTLARGSISMGAFPSSSAAEPSTLSSTSATTFGTQSTALPVASDYRCEWRVGAESQAEVCGAVCPSKDALYEHVMGHAAV
ncbi:hypothetical protein JCM11251_003005 [Rhodosporidiobolus azoricus]